MNVKNAEENADPCLPLISDHHDRNIGDFAVTGRNDRVRILRNRALGIAKEPEKEHGQQARNYGPGGASQPAEQNSHDDQRQRVEVSVTNHGEA